MKSTIRPISDLRNKFTEISQIVHEDKPVILTKNGYGDMVVLSIEAFENLRFQSEVFDKLESAEKEAAVENKTYSSKEVLDAVKDKFGDVNV